MAIEAAIQNFGSPVVVFGSRVKGNWAVDSDIDIGVTGYHYRNHKAVKEHMSQFCGLTVDLKRIEHARTHTHTLEIK